MSRAGRTIAVVLGTLLLIVGALLYPVLMRGEAWLSAVWTVPVLAWLPRDARLPVLVALAVVLAAVVVWRMTLAADARTLTLSRRGETTQLFREARITCANVRCAAGTHCEMTGQPKAPKCVPNEAPQLTCVKTGCSGHVCSDQDVITTCEFRPEYACYQQATCERQDDGQCGWTQTPALTACLAGN